MFSKYQARSTYDPSGYQKCGKQIEWVAAEEMHNTKETAGMQRLVLGI